MPGTTEILGALKLYPSKLKSIYCFGSRVYGTHNEKSDWDYVIIANTPDTNKEINYWSLVSKTTLNMHIMTSDHFLQHLNEYRSFAIECFFAPQEFRLFESVRFNWAPKRRSLVHSFTHISNMAWDSSIKKFEENYYSSIKCVFHSIRVPLFAKQILQHGTIVDFKEANYIYEKLQSKNWTLDELDSEFSKIRQESIENLRKP